MVAATANEVIQAFRLEKEALIRAPIELAFEALLEEIGSENEGPPGKPMPMVLEAWPGGRWFRDLGDNAGHLWGHVQVIKPPTLLEITGPLFMSYAAINHLQYRLKAEGGATRLTLVHRAVGEIDPEHRKGVEMGWADWIERTRKRAEGKAGGK
jgi:uncharacterized protein YndB with AHSA1/START domain